MRRSATRPPRSRSARLRESTMANRRKRSTSGKFTIGGPWELILVDGAHRLACLEAARDELRPNGVLLFDNADLEEYREASKLLPGFERRSFSGLGVGAAVDNNNRCVSPPIARSLDPARCWLRPGRRTNSKRLGGSRVYRNPDPAVDSVQASGGSPQEMRGTTTTSCSGR